MKLIEALESSGYKARSYSGRGMYGKRCLATQVASIGDIFLLGTKLGVLWLNIPDHKLMPRVDTIGFEIIVYWPDIPYEDSNETEL